MLQLIKTRPGLLVGSFLFRKDLHSLEFLQNFWGKQFGASSLLLPGINPLKNYYAKEMGDQVLLDRFLVVTEASYPREELLKVKSLSLEWERNWSIDQKRMVNVDIGLLSLENFILATTKNYSHRVYLGQDIFADLTYVFRQGQFHFLPWTYPDYQDPQKVDFFSSARLKLL